MITDRTLEDVVKAKELREKVKRNEVLTDEELLTMEKGSLTISTLNRINEKQQELKEKLNDLGYFNNDFLTKIWQFDDIFKLNDFERMCENINILNRSFPFGFVKKDVEAEFDYKTFNLIESELFELEKDIEATMLKRLKCGTFYCGEVNNK